LQADRQGAPMSGEQSSPLARSLRVASVGVSTDLPCGVHDHAVLLARALERENVSSSLSWLWRTQGTLAASRSQVARWLAQERPKLADGQLDAILLHYSVFAYSHRGVPLFVHPVVSALSRLGIPIVSVLHEYAYPWGRGGARGTLWAATQRAILLDVMRASSAIVVTADFRAAWLKRQPLLPKREAVLAPVFSNLPAPALDRPAQRRPSVGLFGYSYEGTAQTLVLDAMARLHEQGTPAELRLLGAPGQDSATGRQWSQAARERGLSDALRFTGIVGPQELSDALAGCDVLLFADAPGPTSRKTTLAASLASGRPVVALDGRHTWKELTDSGAALVVAPCADALADAVSGLLLDDARREGLGARGRLFAQETMSVERAASVVARLLQRVVARGGGADDAEHHRVGRGG
jgi:glycosyltransferase involved in cell wall biosynthesis